MSRSSRTDPGQPTQRCSSSRAYTVIDTWRSSREKNEETEVFKTKPFAFNRGPWAMVWSLRGESLRICLRDEANRSRILSQETVNVWQGGQGISYVNEPGTFSLEINACGDWIVKVAAIEELD
ncbi:MAG: hypothetical protein ACE5Q6_03440 [Dehalococcoidia bacterium]